MQLILNKKGSSLAVKNGRFWVRYDEQEHFIAPVQLKQILLHSATKLTFEVVNLAIENNIDVQFIDSKGFPFARIWSNRFGSISTIRKNQIAFSESPDAPNWIRYMLVRKADNHLSVMKILEEWKPSANEKVNEISAKIEKYKSKLKSFVIADSNEAYLSFRGYEGVISKAFFEFLNVTLPIQYQFERRSQHPAKDMFNCLLNYAYGMLYGHVEGALIKAGIDPFLGVMHRDEYNRPVLTYDFIEIYRYWADFVVCHLCFQEVIFEDFFDVQNGNYWLNHSGKRILIQTFNDYLAEVVPLNDLSRSRLTHIELEAQSFASRLKKFVSTSNPS